MFAIGQKVITDKTSFGTKYKGQQGEIVKGPYFARDIQVGNVYDVKFSDGVVEDWNGDRLKAVK